MFWINLWPIIINHVGFPKSKTTDLYNTMFNVWHRDSVYQYFWQGCQLQVVSWCVISIVSTLISNSVHTQYQQVFVYLHDRLTCGIKQITEVYMILLILALVTHVRNNRSKMPHLCSQIKTFKVSKTNTSVFEVNYNNCIT